MNIQILEEGKFEPNKSFIILKSSCENVNNCLHCKNMSFFVKVLKVLFIYYINKQKIGNFLGTD